MCCCFICGVVFVAALLPVNFVVVSVVAYLDVSSLFGVVDSLIFCLMSQNYLNLILSR